MSATGGARLARRARPPLPDIENCPEGSPAGKRRHAPQTHPGAPPRFAAQGRHQKQTNCTHPKRACLDIIPKRHLNTNTTASPSATPQTPEPPAHTAASEREAVGGMRCCGGVLKRGNWGKQKAQKHPNAKPTPQTPEPPAHATTPKTKWCVACGAAGMCRGAGKAKGKAHDNVTTAPGTEPPDKRVYINMRAKSSSPPRTARHTSQSE